MAWDTTWKRKLLEQFLHTYFVLRDVRVELAVGSFQIDIRNDTGSTMSRAGEIDRVQIMFFDEPIQMHIDEVQARRRTPVTEQSGLDVFERQRLAQQRILQ